MYSDYRPKNRYTKPRRKIGKFMISDVASQLTRESCEPGNSDFEFGTYVRR